MLLRPRRHRFFLGSALLVFGVLTASWALLTQPSCDVHPGQYAVDDVDEPRQLEADVRRLVEGFGPRDATHPENLDRVSEFLATALREAGGNIEAQPFSIGGLGYRNVIARFGPATGARIVIGAHYDTAGPRPGADDNASGVAGLLALGRRLGRRLPSIPVELVAYSLEEPPHFRTAGMGSAAHAAALARAGVPVRAMISIEMIGCFSDVPDSQEFPSALLKLFYPSVGNFVTVVGRLGEGGVTRRIKQAMRAATPLAVESINAPRFIPGIDFSDHLNYWDRDYPAVMVTDTAFYRNPRYHSVEDTPDTLDYWRMAQVVAGLEAAVAALE
jgi:hypothetical protein